MMLMKIFLLLILQLFSCFSIETKPRLTFDEFFDYTRYSLLEFSPTGRHLIFQTICPSWNTSSYQHALWLYDIEKQTKKLIATSTSIPIQAKWSPSGNYIALLLKSYSLGNVTGRPSINDLFLQRIYLYSLISDKLLPIKIEKHIFFTFTWSNNDSSLYIATKSFWSFYKQNILYQHEWKNAVPYREKMQFIHSCSIYRIDLNLNNLSLPVKRKFIRHLSFSISQLLYVSFEEQLIFLPSPTTSEDLGDLEIYSINLQNTSKLSKLTNNEVVEVGLRLSSDGRHVLFQAVELRSNKGKLIASQSRLYSLNLINGQITRLGEKFHGSINDYTTRSDSSVYILGQLGTQTHIYTQKSPMDDLILHNGWNGTYESIVSSNNNGSIAFIYSSLEKPMEVYFTNNIEQLKLAKAIANENELFTRRNLPSTKVYSWINVDDHRMIEGILHYPPGKFESKNLPLLVFIHGGPYLASLNSLSLSLGEWSSLAASEGWLVLEPNYRGSTGYGDQFVNEIQHRPLSKPGKDILYGVDQLIKDGIADPYRLAVGGYSYGGYLTNWLITQTKRFNAALSGAGVVDLASAWGRMDQPLVIRYLFGGLPWEVPSSYQNEAPIYYLNRVRTPTHIITGEDDKRVPASESYILERALYHLGIPVQLITFPNEGHSLNDNPWYGKIKIREELKWLQKYGNQSLSYKELFSHSEKSNLAHALQLFMFLFSIVIIINT
ncbi:unnamed protein product [Rotaria sordida]|uniref:Peptidase S9 prolyl oligopeptidase catalytic domain-containing protein n=1 Tax=Rotaria sordida TaxID=392033 RepID=A0A818UY35_9BILA|nr:unnamed protein product [Rotaria sordida]